MTQFFDSQMAPLEVLELSFVLVGDRKVVGSPVFGEGVARSPVSVESSANNIVSMLDSNLGVASDLGVFAARTWEIVLRSVKRAFVPTLDPQVFGRSLELSRGEACCVDQEIVLEGLNQLEACGTLNGFPYVVFQASPNQPFLS